VFQQFEQKAPDAGERKRKLTSVGAAVAVYLGIGGAIAALAAGARAPRPEAPPLEVTFAAPNAPPPPPLPMEKKVERAPKKAKPHKVAARANTKASLAPPKEVPTEALDEADPSLLASAELAADDLDERGDEPAPAEPEVAPERERAAVTRPKRKREEVTPDPSAAINDAPPPQLVDEAATSPTANVDNPMPAVPIERRRAGQGGVVVLKVVVTEEGALEEVEVVRGERDLVAAVMAVLPRWRFSPALFEGKPQRVRHVLEIPIRIGG
jgi:TonB family protein